MRAIGISACSAAECFARFAAIASPCAAPAFAALALAFAFLTPYLVPNTSPVEDPTLVAEARALERIEDAPKARLVLSVDLIGQAVSVEVDASDVKPY